MKAIKHGVNQKRIICDADLDDGTRCDGSMFRVIVAESGTRMLCCMGCEEVHEVEEIMDGFLSKEGE